jgi:hypothetical protein
MSSLRKASDNLDLYTTLASISGILIFLNITHKYPFSFDLMHRICSHPFHNAHLEELGLSAKNGIGIKFSFVHLKYISIASVFTHRKKKINKEIYFPMKWYLVIVKEMPFQVTRTLVKAFPDLLHFGGLFFIVWSG